MTSLYERPIVISPVDLITHVARLDQDRKQSLVFRLVDALLNKESQRQPEATSITAEEGEVDLENESNKQIRTFLKTRQILLYGKRFS